MAFKQKNAEVPSESEVHTGTESWNIAQYFTGFAIAVPLRELNELELIARFGTVKMDDEIIMGDDQVDKRRAEAVKRYWTVLKQIVMDTSFKINKKDLETAKEIKEWLFGITKYFDGLLILKQNNLTHEDNLEINEKLLLSLITGLIEKKESYLFLLDNSGLIFKASDDFSIDDIMKDFVEGG